MRYIQILFVVETNDLVKSDDLYYSWIMRSYYSEYISNQGFEDLCIKYDFVHMDGKANYSKKRVILDIYSKTRMFTDGDTYVVYCLDHDKNSSQNASFINEVAKYCSQNNYYLAVCYREIEDVLKIPPGKSKAERVRLFAKRPHKKGFIDQRLLKIELRNITHDYGRSNLCLVVDEIITKGKLFQK